MNILIVGGGHLGRKVAQELDKQGHEVAIIEAVEDKLALLDDDFGGITFNLFPMDINNLKDAGIENCDAVAVTTSDDNLNITVGEIARSVFGIENVVARISDPFRENIFESFGLRTVCPTNMSAFTIINAIVSPFNDKQISIGTNTITFDKVKVDRKCVGQKLSDVFGTGSNSIFGLVTSVGNFILKTNQSQHIISVDDCLIVAKVVD